MAHGGAGGERRRYERDRDGALYQPVERYRIGLETRSYADDRGGDDVGDGAQETKDRKRSLDGRGLFGETDASRHGDVVSDNIAIKGCMFRKERQA